MTSPDSLADRLEKATQDYWRDHIARKHLGAAETRIVDFCLGNSDELLASLRRSAPASGEMREALDLIKELARCDIPGDDGHSYSEETTECESNDLHLMVSKARLLLYSARTPSEEDKQ